MKRKMKGKKNLLRCICVCFPILSKKVKGRRERGERKLFEYQGIIMNKTIIYAAQLLIEETVHT